MFAKSRVRSFSRLLLHFERKSLILSTRSQFLSEYVYGIDNRAFFVCVDDVDINDREGHQGMEEERRDFVGV